MFRDRFWLSLAQTIPVVLLSHDVQMWLGYEVSAFPGSEDLAAILVSTCRWPSGDRDERFDDRRRGECTAAAAPALRPASA